MPAATLPLPTIAEGVLPRKRFTRDEVLQMMDLGLFDGKRCELIDGDLIDKMGQRPPHAIGVQLLTEVLAAIFGLKRVRVQLPIEAAPEDSERNMPEPDGAVLKERSDEYCVRHPRGDELLLAAEVSDTSVRHDSTSKRDLYARAGVSEYWVVDVNRRLLRVHRNLTDGVYGEIADFNETAVIRTSGAPEADIPVAELLPKALD